MRSHISQIMDMGGSVVRFSEAHPDTDEGNTRSAARAKEIVEEMKVAAAEQRAGLLDRASGAVEKVRTRKELVHGPMAHLAGVGKRAQRTDADVGLVFRRKPGTDSYAQLITTGRSMQAAAEANKPALVPHGLSEGVVTQLGELLDRLEAADRQGRDGRGRHKGATARLEELAKELRLVVRTMDARNRQRFQGNGQLLSAWQSASAVLGGPRAESGVVPVEGEPGVAPVAGGAGSAGPTAGSSGGTPTAGGDVRPAA
jgi:hypothetical protein